MTWDVAGRELTVQLLETESQVSFLVSMEILISCSTTIVHQHINFGWRVFLELFHSIPHLV